MNDNSLTIADLHPRQFARTPLDAEEAREINQLLAQMFGWFSLECARALGALHQTGYDPAIEILEAAYKKVNEQGLWSEAHLNLYTGVSFYLADWRIRSAPGELDLQKHIKENLSQYLSGEAIPIRGKNGKGLCDLLIRANDADCPMEVKLHRFDRKAKEQLRRYMDFYKAPIGYAAAPVLETVLDHDMIFIDVSGWKN